MYTEDTLIDTDDWTCPKRLKGKRIDMTWLYPDRNIYALAFEHQRSNTKQLLKDIRKLTAMACLKILIVYHPETNDV